MTPKEKTQDLLLKFSILKDGHNHLVIECSIKAANETLNELLLDRQGFADRIHFWEEVIKELTERKALFNDSVEQP